MPTRLAAAFASPTSAADLSGCRNRAMLETQEPHATMIDAIFAAIAADAQGR
ncbi:MAG: hypothetical protein JXR14_04270 [Paracoccaceae bacterium]